MLAGEPIMGFTVDVHKYFDQIDPELLKFLLIEGGCPEEVMGPYFDFIQGK